MKDERFLPVEKHEPVEDYDDYTEGNADSDELFIGGQADAKELEHTNGKKVNTLYMAS
ncbi:hypothetical protein HYV83_05375 [Candidatus Woesearchaeota archaeon]|nr:hypothetical protein [Candidatus Woesearchaeota archaeon]